MTINCFNISVLCDGLRLSSGRLRCARARRSRTSPSRARAYRVPRRASVCVYESVCVNTGAHCCCGSLGETVGLPMRGRTRALALTSWICQSNARTRLALPNGFITHEDRYGEIIYIRCDLWWTHRIREWKLDGWLVGGRLHWGGSRFYRSKGMHSVGCLMHWGVETPVQCTLWENDDIGLNI